jgi:hypothetical protein
MSTNSKYRDPIALAFRGSGYIPITSTSKGANCLLPLTSSNGKPLSVHYSPGRNEEMILPHPNLRVIYTTNIPVVKIMTSPTSTDADAFCSIIPDLSPNARTALPVQRRVDKRNRSPTRESPSDKQVDHWRSATPANRTGQWLWARRNLIVVSLIISRRRISAETVQTSVVGVLTDNQRRLEQQQD